MKTEKPYDEGSSERFYQKNMDWQLRKDREIKKKQCEMNSESLSNLTFTPKIVEIFSCRIPSNAKTSTIRKIVYLARKASRSSCTARARPRSPTDCWKPAKNHTVRTGRQKKGTFPKRIDITPYLVFHSHHKGVDQTQEEQYQYYAHLGSCLQLPFVGERTHPVDQVPQFHCSDYGVFQDVVVLELNLHLLHVVHPFPDAAEVTWTYFLGRLVVL